MSTKYLGETFDIHTGGVEHLPVHHTNEVAQAEMALGVHPWVNVWMHEDWILFEGGKMSKSLGNIRVLEDLVKDGFHPLAYRYFLLQAHYRKQQHYNAEAMEAAQTGYLRLLQTAVSLRDAQGEPDEAAIAPWLERFREAVRDDLNAPRALAVAIEALRSDALSKADRRHLLTPFDAWLGLGLLTESPPEATQEEDPRIDALVANRQAARERRDFAEADRIRDELASEDIVIEDTPDGPLWKRR
jgi:cysteinyl-tRNA synthetase